MRSDLTFRSPLASDLEAIAALEAASFVSPWKAEFFASELDVAERYNLVLESPDGRLVGYLFTMYCLDELHVNKIAVDPAWRREGIATGIMNRCFSFAEENGIVSITLEVRESNTAARALYRALGFSEIHLRERYYPDGEGAVVMERRAG
jgi:[ribosomal protein S18]-alanine N-acetyltransferase